MQVPSEIPGANLEKFNQIVSEKLEIPSEFAQAVAAFDTARVEFLALAPLVFAKQLSPEEEVVLNTAIAAVVQTFSRCVDFINDDLTDIDDRNKGLVKPEVTADRDVCMASIAQLMVGDNNRDFAQFTKDKNGSEEPVEAGVKRVYATADSYQEAKSKLADGLSLSLEADIQRAQFTEELRIASAELVVAQNKLVEMTLQTFGTDTKEFDDAWREKVTIVILRFSNLVWLINNDPTIIDNPPKEGDDSRITSVATCIMNNRAERLETFRQSPQGIRPTFYPLNQSEVERGITDIYDEILDNLNFCETDADSRKEIHGALLDYFGDILQTDLQSALSSK